VNLDFSVIKAAMLHESVKLRFRAEAFNLTEEASRQFVHSQ
jgi:hypothetical protein